MRPRRPLLPLLAVLVLFAAFAGAQNTVGEIPGYVRDPSGAVLPGASMTAVFGEIAVSRRVTTDGQGFYLIANLPNGQASLIAELSGSSTTGRSPTGSCARTAGRVSFRPPTCWTRNLGPCCRPRASIVSWPTVSAWVQSCIASRVAGVSCSDRSRASNGAAGCGCAKKRHGCERSGPFSNRSMRMVDAGRADRPGQGPARRGPGTARNSQQPPASPGGLERPARAASAWPCSNRAWPRSN